MPFGRHKGQPLSALPDDYLDWLASLDLRPPLRRAVEAEQARRAARDNAGAGRSTAAAITDPVVARAASRIVQAGYRTAAMEAHPDRGGDTATMQAINRAAELLRRFVGVGA